MLHDAIEGKIHELKAVALLFRKHLERLQGASLFRKQSISEVQGAINGMTELAARTERALTTKTDNGSYFVLRNDADIAQFASLVGATALGQHLVESINGTGGDGRAEEDALFGMPEETGRFLRDEPLQACVELIGRIVDALRTPSAEPTVEREAYLLLGESSESRLYRNYKVEYGFKPNDHILAEAFARRVRILLDIRVAKRGVILSGADTKTSLGLVTSSLEKLLRSSSLGRSEIDQSTLVPRLAALFQEVLSNLADIFSQSRFSRPGASDRTLSFRDKITGRDGRVRSSREASQLSLLPQFVYTLAMCVDLNASLPSEKRSANFVPGSELIRTYKRMVRDELKEFDEFGMSVADVLAEIQKRYPKLIYHRRARAVDELVRNLLSLDPLDKGRVLFASTRVHLRILINELESIHRSRTRNVGALLIAVEPIIQAIAENLSPNRNVLVSLIYVNVLARAAAFRSASMEIDIAQPQERLTPDRSDPLASTSPFGYTETGADDGVAVPLADAVEELLNKRFPERRDLMLHLDQVPDIMKSVATLAGSRLRDIPDLAGMSSSPEPSPAATRSYEVVTAPARNEGEELLDGLAFVIFRLGEHVDVVFPSPDGGRTFDPTDRKRERQFGTDLIELEALATQALDHALGQRADTEDALSLAANLIVALAAASLVADVFDDDASDKGLRRPLEETRDYATTLIGHLAKKGRFLDMERLKRTVDGLQLGEQPSALILQEATAFLHYTLPRQ